MSFQQPVVSVKPVILDLAGYLLGPKVQIQKNDFSEDHKIFCKKNRA